MYELLEIKPRFSTASFLVLLISTAFWANASYTVGILLSILTVGLLFLTSGFIIDKKNKRIKIFTYFFGVRFGKWRVLPELKYVSVLRVRLKKKTYSASSRQFEQITSGSYTYRISLVLEDKREKPLRLTSTNKEKAIEEGLKLGEYLNLNILDSTTIDRKWIGQQK